MTDYSDWSLEDLVAERLRVAERVNRQMRRMEAAGETTGNVFAAKAKPWLIRQGRKRFSTYKGPQKVNEYIQTSSGPRRKTEAEIREAQRRKEIAELGIMEQIQSAQTYTVRGVVQRRKKFAETMRREWEIDLSEEEIRKLFELDAFEWVRQTLGSLTMMALARSINSGASTADEVRDRINQMRARAMDEEEFAEMAPEDLFDELGLEFKEEYLQYTPRREEEHA